MWGSNDGCPGEWGPRGIGVCMPGGIQGWGCCGNMVPRDLGSWHVGVRVGGAGGKRGPWGIGVLGERSSPWDGIKAMVVLGTGSPGMGVPGAERPRQCWSHVWGSQENGDLRDGEWLSGHGGHRSFPGFLRLWGGSEPSTAPNLGQPRAVLGCSGALPNSSLGQVPQFPDSTIPGNT